MSKLIPMVPNHSSVSEQDPHVLVLEVNALSDEERRLVLQFIVGYEPKAVQRGLDTLRAGRLGVAQAAHAAPVSFTCPKCGRTSYHPKDAEEGYCGACNEWTGPANAHA